MRLTNSFRLCLAAALVLACAGVHADPPKKIVLVILENTNYPEAVAAPFLGGVVAKRGVLLTDFHAIGHPSQPNYLALVSGSPQGVWDDNNYNISRNSIVDLLEGNLKSWHVYAEGYPGNCFMGATSNRYVRKHNPLISFTNIQRNPARCANITNESTFVSDFTDRRLADFTMYIPDLDDDGHDTGVMYADNWLSKIFGPLLQNTTAMQDVIVVVTFDEDDGSDINHIYTAFYGPNVKGGIKLSAHYDHYSLLRTFEDLFGLGTLGLGDWKSIPIAGFLN